MKPALLIAVMLALSVGICDGSPVTPDNDRVFTSTRSVTRMAVGPEGSLWVATTGGVLRRAPKGAWSRASKNDAPPMAAASVNWRGESYAASPKGLRRRNDKGWHEIALPKSSGTHVSALAVWNGKLLASMFGDGLYLFDGKSWSPMDIGLPTAARRITAMASSGSDLWIGTLDNGVWTYGGKSWVQHLEPDEPYNANCQAMFSYKGSLFLSTLDQGLVVRTPQGWKRFAPPEISSVSPREMVELGGALYVRHGPSEVDRFDGAHWEKDIAHGLPRAQAYALAADSKLLYVARWGGWSEFDENRWASHLDIPELQGLSPGELLPDGDKLWIAIQGHGIAEVDRTTGKLKWHDEREGLPDDWVKSLLKVGNTLYAGAFAGGLAFFDGKAWAVVPESKESEITALEPDGAGGVYFAMRKGGVYCRTGSGTVTRIANPILPADEEVQSLLPVPGGLWVGGRTGIYFFKD